METVPSTSGILSKGQQRVATCYYKTERSIVLTDCECQRLY